MRRFIAFAAKAAISALLLYVALDLVSFTTLRQRVGQIELAWLVAAFVALVIQVILVALRWQVIANACGVAAGQKRIFLYTLIGLFFNQTLPSTIGGDAARMWLLARRAGKWKSAVHSVIIDRASGLIWLTLLVLACLPWSLALIQNQVGRTALIVIGIGGIGGVAALFLLAHAGQRLLHRWRLTRHLAELSLAAWRVLTAPRVGGKVAALSIPVHLLGAFAAWCMAQSIGSPLDLSTALFLILPVILIAAIPISIAGWGVREGAMVAAFTYGGLPEGDGLVVSLLFGASLFLIGALGGLVWILSAERVQIKPADDTDPPRAA